MKMLGNIGNVRWQRCGEGKVIGGGIYLFIYQRYIKRVVTRASILSIFSLIGK